MSYLDEQRKLPKVPVRYTGAHVVRLRQVDGPHRDANNVPLESLLLPQGDTLMMGAIEVYGTTYLTDPRGEKPPEWLGLGRVVLPEHKHYSDAELSVAGYEFQSGRTDVEPLTSREEYLKRQQPVQQEARQSEQQPQQQAPIDSSGGSEVKEEEEVNGTGTVSG